MEANYKALRMVVLRALMRENGLQGYSRLRKKKADSIAFLWDNFRPRPTLEPMPASPQSVKLRIKPPKPKRPPPPPAEGLFIPYEFELSEFPNRWKE